MGTCMDKNNRDLNQKFHEQIQENLSHNQNNNLHYLVQQQLIRLKVRYNVETIKYADLCFDSVLGKSPENSTTFCGYFQGEQVAIKVKWIDEAQLGHLDFEMKLTEFLQDIERICKITYKYPSRFVKIKGVCIDKLPIIIQEYSNQRDLITFYKTARLNYKQKIEISVQVCEAMSHLHT